MSLETIRKRLHSGEDVSTEFVLNGSSTATIGRTVCAFLNSKGGQVYCGVNDEGEVVGVKGSVDLLAQRLERDLKDRISPTSVFSADVVAVDG